MDDDLTPELSVVIPCYNVARTLADQLDALLAEEWDGVWEVIVVDNGSTDGTARIAGRYRQQHARLRVISATDGQSIAYARNAGFRAARGELIAVCDGDDVVQPGWLAAMGDTLRSHRYVSGTVDPALLNPSWLSGTRPIDSVPRLPEYAGQPFASGATLGVARTLWQELGGFDERLRGLEDIEFGIRARAIGEIPTHAQGAVVGYRYRLDLRSTWRQGFNYGRGRHEQNRRARAFGLEAAPLTGAIKSWLWVVSRLPTAATRRGRYALTWVLANRIGAVRGAFDHYPTPQIDIGHRSTHQDLRIVAPTTTSRYHGVLVTFRRHQDLRASLQQLADQSHPLDTVFVVDNDDDPDVAELVRAADVPFEITYLPNPGNPGPAGGIHAGARAVLAVADDADWLVVLDDDDPPRRADSLESLQRILRDLVTDDPRCAGIGLWGASLDRGTGRLRAAGETEPVQVTYLPGGSCPHYSIAALRRVGLPSPDLFFGFDDLELGLRLSDAGFRIYSSGIAREHGWTNMVEGRRVSLRTSTPTWRRYYSLRNLVIVLRAHGLTRAAAVMSLVGGLAKPVANLVVRPRSGWANLRTNVRALSDGWRGRAGKTLDPAREIAPRANATFDVNRRSAHA